MPITSEGTGVVTPFFRTADTNGQVYNIASAASVANVAHELQVINSLTPNIYDYISLSYTGSNLTQVLYKVGGSGGTTISTLTLAYNGNDLISVTKT